MTQGKEKDFDSIVPRFSYCDMQEDIRKQVVDVCRDAYKRQHDGEFKYFKDLAMHVKKSLDNDLKDDMGQRTLDGAWHVVVGKFAMWFITRIGTSYGSYVSYEHKCIAMFWLEHIGFLCYKHG